MRTRVAVLALKTPAVGVLPEMSLGLVLFTLANDLPRPVAELPGGEPLWRQGSKRREKEDVKGKRGVRRRL